MGYFFSIVKLFKEKKSLYVVLLVHTNDPFMFCSLTTATAVRD
jgi:hypothetical protein